MGELEPIITRRQVLTNAVSVGSSILLAGSLPPRSAFAETSYATPTSEENSDTDECLTIPTEIKSAAEKAFLTSYKEWNELYLKNEGLPEGQLKIEYSKDENDSASEVVAYGMIFAVHAGDKETFDGLWSFAKSHLNEDGLMQFHVGSDNSAVDESSASDADLDIAYSLYVATEKWGEAYEEDARAMMSNILEHDIEEETYVLKGGNDWGGSDLTNPSYYSPFYYEVFKDFTGDTRWDLVAEAGRKVLGNIDSRRESKTDLPPNWTKADGTPADESWLDDENGYSHEAIRVPLRQGLAALNNCDNPIVTSHAKGQLEKILPFVEKLDPDEIKEGYDENGTPLNEWSNNPAFAGTFAIASLAGEDPILTQKLVQNTIEWRSKDWVTNEGVRNFSLLVLSGKMIS